MYTTGGVHYHWFIQYVEPGVLDLGMHFLHISYANLTIDMNVEILYNSTIERKLKIFLLID